MIAAACIGGGAVLIIGRPVYGSSLEFLRKDLSVSAAQIGNKNLNVNNLDVTFITVPLGVILLIFGVIIGTLCILGIIAASGQFYKFIIVYLVLLACVFFAQVVILICVYIDRAPFDSTVKRLLKSSLSSFTDINGEDSFTLGWNAVMSYFKCCGVDGYLDFSIAGYPKSVMPGPHVAVTPQICCIDKTVGDCVEQAKYATKTYYKYGCYEHIWDYVTSETGLIIFGVYFIMLLEYLCLFFALWLICLRRSMGISKVSDYQ
ncbi:unnamed protein product [Candidula unifasciata]|uniref:Tetraspanin n=1 Tax=Candidula unifasciata TaxID=100452 RepID=A0A8S3ZFH3_9EUPU|nr:unnamed protein product [Candidula unifasciata]